MKIGGKGNSCMTGEDTYVVVYKSDFEYVKLIFLLEPMFPFYGKHSRTWLWSRTI